VDDLSDVTGGSFGRPWEFWRRKIDIEKSEFLASRIFNKRQILIPFVGK
jgi:hypothetical protein